MCVCVSVCVRPATTQSWVVVRCLFPVVMTDEQRLCEGLTIRRERCLCSQSAVLVQSLQVALPFNALQTHTQIEPVPDRSHVDLAVLALGLVLY